MSRQGVEQLLDRWAAEPTFREALRTDPEGTIRASGAELDNDEWAALRAMDWSLSDEELHARANKMM